MVNENGCVIGWPARHDKDGYPITNCGRKYRLVVRLLYELFVGPIPEGLQIRHDCDNRACINPLHVRFGTPADNTRDKVSRGRQFTRYADTIISEVRSGKHSAVDAWALWGMSKSQFYRIRNGEQRIG